MRNHFVIILLLVVLPFASPAEPKLSAPELRASLLGTWEVFLLPPARHMEAPLAFDEFRSPSRYSSWPWSPATRRGDRGAPRLRRGGNDGAGLFQRRLSRDLLDHRLLLPQEDKPLRPGRRSSRRAFASDAVPDPRIELRVSIAERQRNRCRLRRSKYWTRDLPPLWCRFVPAQVTFASSIRRSTLRAAAALVCIAAASRRRTLAREALRRNC